MADSRLGKKVPVPAGVVILSEGEHQTSAYRILSGRVEVFKTVHGRRVVLARLGPGQFFGEMNLVLEAARSASVLAMEPCVLRVITQETFNRLLRREPKSVMPLLKVLFERLRIMNLKYVQALEAQTDAALAAQSALDAAAPPQASNPGELHEAASLAVPRPGWVVVGETELAARIVGKGGKTVEQFPFRIGRKSGFVDAFSLNDLSIPDSSPYTVSRNHCAIDLAPGGDYHVQDRGSRLGTIVNGERIGAHSGRLEAPLRPGKNVLVLGSPHSPFRFALNPKTK